MTQHLLAGLRDTEPQLLRSRHCTDIALAPLSGLHVSTALQGSPLKQHAYTTILGMHSLSLGAVSLGQYHQGSLTASHTEK